MIPAMRRRIKEALPYGEAALTEIPPPPFETSVVRGKLDAQLSYQSSATMSIWYYNGSAEADTGDNVTVYDWLLSSGQTIASGKQVTAALDARSGRYYVIAAQCA